MAALNINLYNFFFESSRLHFAVFRIVNKAIQLCDCMRVCVRAQFVVML